MKPIIAVPATAALVYRAYSRKSLTPLGIFVALLTAIAHALHPWSVFFALLAVFFLAGSAVTKVKHEVKAKLTQHASGSSGGEGARNHIQVLSNSIVASVLTLLHARTLTAAKGEACWSNHAAKRHGDVLVLGIVANYAAVAADTFSSELGILSSSKPRLITAPWRTVPAGTNGGVTATGINAGLLGAAIISVTATVLMPFCAGSGPRWLGGKILRDESGWDLRGKMAFALAMTVTGALGSLLDSALGALLQASVVDVRTGKIIEGESGRKVMVNSPGSFPMRQRAGAEAKNKGAARYSVVEADRKAAQKARPQSRRVEVGRDMLSNNGVNLVMAATISMAAIVGAAWLWNVPLGSVLA